MMIAASVPLLCTAIVFWTAAIIGEEKTIELVILGAIYMTAGSLFLSSGVAQLQAQLEALLRKK